MEGMWARTPLFECLGESLNSLCRNALMSKASDLALVLLWRDRFVNVEKAPIAQKKPLLCGGALVHSYGGQPKLGTFGLGNLEQVVFPFGDLLVNSEFTSLWLVRQLKHNVQHDFFDDGP